MGEGMDRCGGHENVGASSVSDCKKIGSWNVRSLNKPGKWTNVISEMKRMRVGILGVAESWWEKDGSFTTQLPESEGGDKYKVGKKRRRGVGVIVREEVIKSVMMCEPISERIMLMRLKVAPINVLLVQIYAPN